MGQTRVETENKIHTRTIKISCKISLKEVSLEFYLTGKLATFCQLGKCLVLKSYSDTVFRNLLANLQNLLEQNSILKTLNHWPIVICDCTIVLTRELPRV